MPKNQSDLPAMEGPGVAEIKDKRLEKLADEFCEVRDRKAELAEELTGIETKILDRMSELQISRYRFSDQELLVKDGKTHVKVKTVRMGDSGGEADEDGDEE